MTVLFVIKNNTSNWPTDDLLSVLQAVYDSSFHPTPSLLSSIEVHVKTSGNGPNAKANGLASRCITLTMPTRPTSTPIEQLAGSYLDHKSWDFLVNRLRTAIDKALYPRGGHSRKTTMSCSDIKIRYDPNWLPAVARKQIKSELSEVRRADRIEVLRRCIKRDDRLLAGLQTRVDKLKALMDKRRDELRRLTGE
jgi:hypothetical protein